MITIDLGGTVAGGTLETSMLDQSRLDRVDRVSKPKGLLGACWDRGPPDHNGGGPLL